MSERRRFSRKEINAMSMVTGRTGHGDHIIPFSKGGKTQIDNLQILSPKMNQTKGAHSFTPREWQDHFLDTWSRREEGRSFLLIAIPGSGKTCAALEAGRRWMAGGADRRLMVVVPTDGLREQWRNDAGSIFGIDLQSKEFGTNFKHGYQGGVTTYQTVSSNSLLFRSLCSVAPTMVVFDEIHHCGEGSSFGDGIKTAFSMAAEKLPMSGTPWQTSGKPIPFVRYGGDGYPIGDYRYDYPNALTDGVVRYLVFHHSKGVLINDITGATVEVSEGITEEEAKRRLTPLLDPSGQYVRQQIHDAHQKLMECRRTVKDAGGLTLCTNQEHARAVAKAIREVTGCEPSVIVSDEDLANDSIKSFRDSDKEWLVAVKQVSEGTDIKRLQVLNYLTNVVTELFFRQAIGRVSRVRDLEDYEGHVFLPSDPRLLGFARNIENAQVIAIKEEAERTEREMKERQLDVQDDLPTWSTQHGGIDTILLGSKTVSRDEYARLESVAQAHGIPISKVSDIFAAFQNFPQTQTISTASAPPPVDRQDLEKRLRDECSRKARSLAFKKGQDFAHVHAAFVPSSGIFTPQNQMSIDQLNEKIAWLNKELARP